MKLKAYFVCPLPNIRVAKKRIPLPNKRGTTLTILFYIPPPRQHRPTVSFSMPHDYSKRLRWYGSN